MPQDRPTCFNQNARYFPAGLIAIMASLFTGLTIYSSRADKQSQNNTKILAFISGGFWLLSLFIGILTASKDERVSRLCSRLRLTRQGYAPLPDEPRAPLEDGPSQPHPNNTP